MIEQLYKIDWDKIYIPEEDVKIIDKFYNPETDEIIAFVERGK